jgi:hypothetical protein
MAGGLGINGGTPVTEAWRAEGVDAPDPALTHANGTSPEAGTSSEVG